MTLTVNIKVHCLEACHLLVHPAPNDLYLLGVVPRPTSFPVCPRHFTYCWSCSLIFWLLDRYPISWATEPSYGSIHSFLQDFWYLFPLDAGSLSTSGSAMQATESISFLCISLYLSSFVLFLSVCFVPSAVPFMVDRPFMILVSSNSLSVSVSLPRALGCLVYWSTDHFRILVS